MKTRTLRIIFGLTISWLTGPVLAHPAAFHQSVVPVDAAHSFLGIEHPFAMVAILAVVAVGLRLAYLRRML